MRQLTGPQLAAIKSELLTLCKIVTITQTNGVVVKLTDHDIDVSGYKSQFGLELSAILAQLGAGGQTGTVTCLPDRNIPGQGGITYQDIEAGYFDNASIQIAITDYTNFDLMLLCTGTIVDAKLGNASTIELTVNTPLNTERPICGDTISTTCRADFGDSKCKMDLTQMVDGPHVFAALDAQSFLMTRDEHTPPGYYNNGTCYFTSGTNKGTGYEILSTSLQTNDNPNETITLKVPMANQPAKGDAIVLYPGCDKVFSSGCSYWRNTQNFQGEPFALDPSDVLPTSINGDGTVSGINTGLPASVNWWLAQYMSVGFGKTVTLASGSRILSEVSAADSDFYDTVVTHDVYQAIYNACGGAAAVSAMDGTLTPVDATAKAALANANWLVPLNLAVGPVSIQGDGNVANTNQLIQNALAPVFFANPPPPG